MGAHPGAALDLELVDASRARAGRVAAHLVEGPAQVDGRRAGRCEHGVGRLEILSALGREGVGVRRRHADRGSPANGEAADRVCHLLPRPATQLDLVVWKPSLVEEDDRVVLEADYAMRIYVPSSHEAR